MFRPVPTSVSSLFALLIGNGAGSLASGLAGRLTLAAAAFGSSGLQVLFVDGLDVFHFVFLLRTVHSRFVFTGGVSYSRR